MKKTPLFLLALLVASVGEAQSVGGKDAFQLSQAVAEMRRVISQVDVLQNNQDDLSTRLSGIEAAKNEIDSLRSEVAALRSEIDALRRELNAQQGRIIDDLTKKLVKMQPVETPRKTTPQKTVVYDGPCVEYTVEKGDTLSIIAKAFETSVQQIKDINGLKSDNIGVGKVLKVPAPKK